MTKTKDDSLLPNDPSCRMIAILLVGVTDSNVNGDPERGGQPRQDDITGQGIISPQCQKRWARDFAATHGGKDLYVARGGDLTALHDKYRQEVVKGKKDKAGKEKVGSVDTEKMLKDMWDLRMFGGLVPRATVKVRGAVQIGPARSIDEVLVENQGFTRVSGYLDDGKSEEASGDASDDDGDDKGVLRGTKQSYAIVRYGLYKSMIVFNPLDAKKNGVTAEDITLLWDGFIQGLEYTRSAHRVHVNLHGLYVFATPDERGGFEPGHVTASRIQVALKPSISAPSKFGDYLVEVNETNLPKGMLVGRWEPRTFGMPKGAEASVDLGVAK